MSKITLERWERDFRAAAEADGYTVFRDHLRRLELPDYPESLLEGTILAIRASCDYLALDELDGKYLEQLLELPQYNPANSAKAVYAVTLDLAENTYARMLVEPRLRSIDLADLYSHPWWDYETAGFTWLWVARADRCELTSGEFRQLEDDVTFDLRFDYCEEEVDFWFDPSLDETCLLVCVYDVEDFTMYQF